MKRPQPPPAVFLTALVLSAIGVTILAGCASYKRAGGVTVTDQVRITGDLGNTLAGADELWVIGRPDVSESEADGAPSSGAGAMLITGETGWNRVALPLARTDIRAAINAFIGTVEVNQKFSNSFDRIVSATYEFPLPQDAAVNDFILTIGPRRIRGVLRERAEAEAIFQEAKRQGYVASFFTQDRRNLFRQSVANIGPGREIEVSIKYFQTIPCRDGWRQFVLPMTTRTRASAATVLDSMQPAERDGHDISVRVDLSAEAPIDGLVCNTHRIAVEKLDGQHLSVSLADTGRIPNRDFILRYRPGGGGPKTMLLTHRDESGGYFALQLCPPQDLTAPARVPMEMLFLVDCSTGPAADASLAQAKKAIARALEFLHEDDTYLILGLGNAETSDRLLVATRENVAKGREFLSNSNSAAGCDFLVSLRKVVDLPSDPGRRRCICLLTDGHAANPDQLLMLMRGRLGGASLLCVGTGPAPARRFLEQMATIAGGAVAFPGGTEDPARAIEDYYRQVSHPALTHVELDWGAMKVGELRPAHLPDLYAGHSLLVTGRFAGRGATTLRLTGRAGERVIAEDLSVNLEDEAPAGNDLPAIWARGKIASLAARMGRERDPQLLDAMRQAALDYNLVSPFTAFMAVDARSKAPSAPASAPAQDGANH